MTHVLTPGRWRGLKSTSMRNNIFSILAFDQRGSYRKMLPASTSYDEAVAIKREVVVALSFHVSAVLLDNQYGLPAVLDMNGGSGVMMSLEESGYSGDATYRKLIFNEQWTAEKIKRMGASAVKLLAYYHPHSGALAEEIEGVISAVCDECHRHDLPLFLEPMSYSLDANIAKESAEFAKQRPQIVKDTAERLSRLKPDVLKLEFPIDAAFDTDHAGWRTACEAVSAASSVPWVLLSAGVDFSTFEEQTRIACESGASGWLAGRAIWKESVTMSPADRQAFLAGKAAERIDRLNTIASAAARPWTEFYSPIAATQDWFV
ncbi:MAG: tagatose 1,6-diphosphate aldolase [Anaerolineae bacterium]|nr:tagatose 1,6-diphosphate aldolase [Anaerolineae bacterium]